jgi:osmotically inducible protein OsmC
MQRKANARWQGTAREGTGTLSVQSGTLRDTPYTFKARFGDGKGTNPEELIAAAHAGCFTMALSAQLGQAGLTAETLDTECTITLEKQPDGFAITESRLDLKARVPGATQEQFDQAVNEAKAGCPVSKLYQTNITVTSKLEG